MYDAPSLTIQVALLHRVIPAVCVPDLLHGHKTTSPPMPDVTVLFAEIMIIPVVSDCAGALQKPLKLSHNMSLDTLGVLSQVFKLLDRVVARDGGAWSLPLWCAVFAKKLFLRLLLFASLFVSRCHDLFFVDTFVSQRLCLQYSKVRYVLWRHNIGADGLDVHHFPRALLLRVAVETIGSEFMAVSGLPSKLKHHPNTAYAAIVTALDMLHEVLQVLNVQSVCPR
jgi:hypothetical protein